MNTFKAIVLSICLKSNFYLRKDYPTFNYQVHYSKRCRFCLLFREHSQAITLQSDMQLFLPTDCFFNIHNLFRILTKELENGNVVNVLRKREAEINL